MSVTAELASAVTGLVGDRAEAEVVVRTGHSALTRFANSFIHQNVAAETTSVTVRLAVDGRVLSAETNKIDRNSLSDFVNAALAATALQPPDRDWPGLAEPTSARVEDRYDDATAAADPAARAEQVKAFVEAGPATTAAGYCETTGHTVAFANSLGHTADGRYTSATIDGIHQTSTSAGSAHQASSRFEDLDGAAAGALAARRAGDSAEAVDIEPGDYEVVLAPEATATIAIFLSAYGLQAKAYREGQSFARLGDQQFDERVTLTDDATDPRGIGLWFDTEGTIRSRLELIDGGTTVGLAHDRRTAAKEGVKSTGHAFAGSEVWGPQADTLFVAPGATTPDQLVADVERGLYVATFNYCRVLEPKSLVVTGLTRNGTFMIEDGRLTGAVTNLRFTQSFVEGLAPGKVLGVGNDARHADCELGANYVHAPSLRLASWHFSGGAEG